MQALTGKLAVVTFETLKDHLENAKKEVLINTW